MANLMTGAEIVFKALEDQGVEHIFGYPGGAVLPIYDELKNHKKIEKRVEKMFDEGAVDEVKFFLKMKVYHELSSNKIIGIKEINDYLQGKITLIKAKELITQKTRQYAKRQFTWARGHMKSWDMIYSPDINDLFNKAINKIS